MFEDAARGAAFVPMAGVVVEKLIQESLVWKAGKVAAAVRYAAVVCLGTMVGFGVRSIKGLGKTHHVMTLSTFSDAHIPTYSSNITQCKARRRRTSS